MIPVEQKMPWLIGIRMVKLAPGLKMVRKVEGEEVKEEAAYC